MSQFDDFWDALPSKRRNNKKGCAEKWKAKKLDEQAPVIMAWVRRMKQTDEWKRGYNPSPMTILNQERWNDGIPEDERKRAVSGPTVPRPDQLVADILEHRKLTENQRGSMWNWIMKGGVIAGVQIPDDPETGAAGFTVMHGEIETGTVTF